MLHKVFIIIFVSILYQSRNLNILPDAIYFLNLKRSVKIDLDWSSQKVRLIRISGSGSRALDNTDTLYNIKDKDIL